MSSYNSHFEFRRCNRGNVGFVLLASVGGLVDAWFALVGSPIDRILNSRSKSVDSHIGEKLRDLGLDHLVMKHFIVVLIDWSSVASCCGGNQQEGGEATRGWQLGKGKSGRR